IQNAKLGQPTQPAGPVRANCNQFLEPVPVAAPVPESTSGRANRDAPPPTCPLIYGITVCGSAYGTL
ncbi:MAG: hypothetical protein ABWY93_34930, partial [Mycobacterium sp.]